MIFTPVGHVTYIKGYIHSENVWITLPYRPNSLYIIVTKSQWYLPCLALKGELSSVCYLVIGIINTPNKHPIARPWGRDMVCVLQVQLMPNKRPAFLAVVSCRIHHNWFGPRIKCISNTSIPLESRTFPHKMRPEVFCADSCGYKSTLTHWGRYKMGSIFQTTFNKWVCWMKMYKFRLKFRWSLCPSVELTIFQHCFG